MPVRSRGSLLAGTAFVISLSLAGSGCQNGPASPDHDAFAIRNTSGQQSRNLLTFLHRGPTDGTPVQPQTVAGYAPVYAPSAVTLQPVPPAQTPATPPAVIASSWQPVRRVSAEVPVNAPELSGGVSVGQSPVGVRIPLGGTLQPPGPSGAVGGSGPGIDEGPGVLPPGGTTLPAPRALESMAPVVVGASGPPPHLPGKGSMPREFEKMALPPYQVEPPDILLIQASAAVTLKLQAVEGQHLIGPDGTVNLGIYGKVFVAGMTLEQVADVVAARLREKANQQMTVEEIKKELQVDVLAYNSKFYYVITDGGGYGQQVYPIPVTGNETVLDALAKVNGLPSVASKKNIWLARATRDHTKPKIYPVDWRAITQCGSAGTNYQIFPGDRVYVQSDFWIRTDTWLAKRLSPILRGFGATLLGASTVNVIKSGGTFGGGLGGIR